MFFLSLPFAGTKRAQQNAQTIVSTACMYYVVLLNLHALKRSNIRLLSKSDRFSILPLHKDERLYMVDGISCPFHTLVRAIWRPVADGDQGTYYAVHATLRMSARRKGSGLEMDMGE